MKNLLVVLHLVISVAASAAEEPTYIVPEDVFNSFSQEKRIEYVEAVLTVLYKHEQTWNAEMKYSLIELLLPSAQAQAPDAKRVCIIGTRKLIRDTGTKMCTTQIASPCEGAPRNAYQCGSFNLNKCVPRLPIATLSQRCFEATMADKAGLAAITQPQIEEAVKLYQSACNSSGDYNGCFFLAQQLRVLNRKVGTRICDKMDDNVLLEKGNILTGNGRQAEKASIPYLGDNGQTKSINLGNFQCGKCHGNTLYEFTENEEWKKENNEDDRAPLATDSIVLARIRSHPSHSNIRAEIEKERGITQKEVESAMESIGCIMGRFIDIGLRYQTVISPDRNNWRMPASTQPTVSSPTAPANSIAPNRAPSRSPYQNRHYRKHRGTR